MTMYRVTLNRIVKSVAFVEVEANDEQAAWVVAEELQDLLTEGLQKSLAKVRTILGNVAIDWEAEDEDFEADDIEEV